MASALKSEAVRRLTESAAMATVYYALGRLGLFLAIHPGHVAVVWPVSGIALAGTLLFGWRIGPGILLGSFLVNIGIFWDITARISVPAALAVTISIAIGAVLQAWAGAFLIRRFATYPTLFVESRDVIKFLLLGGPVSCVVSATCGVTSFLLGGVIHPVDYSFHWWTWWIGDSIGVVTFAPLVLIWIAKAPEISLRRKITVTVPLCLALTLVVAFFAQTSAWQKDRMKLILERQTDRTARQLQRNIEHYIDVLHAIEGLFISSAHVSREQFKGVVSYWFIRRPGIRALTWNPRIFDAERMQYEQAARSDGVSNFQIKEQRPDGTWVPAARRAEYVPAYYIESLNSNRRALGFDEASDHDRLQALNQARDTGTVSTTDPLRLMQNTRQPGFLVFLPIYRSGFPPRTLEERRLDLRGYIGGAFRISDIMDNVLKAADLKLIEVRLYDLRGEDNKRLLYTYRPQGNQIADARAELTEATELAPLKREIPVDVADRRWSVEFVPTKAYLIALRQWEVWGVPLSGLILTCMLNAFLLASTGQNSRLQSVNAKLENEIAEHNTARADLDRFAVIVDSAEEAIIGTTWGEALITTWNKGAERLYGYSAEEATGRSIFILYPAEGPDEKFQLRQKLERGEPVAQHETVRVRKNGTPVHVSLTLSLMKDATGKIIGVSSISNDITERKAAEAKLRQDREAVALRLHDSILQSLSAIGMHLEMAQRLLYQDPQTAWRHLARIGNVLSNEQQDLRFFVKELKGVPLPRSENGHGELAALETLVKTLETQWSVNVELKAEPAASGMLEGLVENLAYIIREGVSNAVRHGRASMVSIEIAPSGDKLLVRIVDNGRGFPSPVDQATGPRMLRSRVVSLGGSLTICPSERGASIEIILPLSRRGV